MAGFDAFGKLHPLVQRKLYDMRWTELRPIQVEATKAFFAHGRHLILAAETASGKTEAAFLPILSQMLTESEKGLRAIYVSPLRALINDQFQRLEDLCGRMEIPVFKWHGDVASPLKKKFLADPRGLLLITPESIESIFINHSEHVARLFKNVSWLVLDEMHAFIGTERGMHLRSLLARVDQARIDQARRPMRRLGLSATLGDFEASKKWLNSRNFGDGDGDGDVELVAESGSVKEILYRIKGYTVGAEGQSPWVGDMIRLFPATSLIFVNSRTMLEHLAYTVQRYVEKKRLPDRYRVHHGSLSRIEREDTEDALKTQDGIVTFCSSTMELGIDVGSVARVGQFGAPWSVSALRQRLGRSGRKDGESSAMALFIVDGDFTTATATATATAADASVVRKIRPELLQAIAMSELMFDRWNEPPDVGRPHYSTLVQQCLSVVAERGGISAAGLYDTLVLRGAFDVPRAAFAEVLRSLGAHDLLEQTGEGDLVMGVEGERIVRNKDFYTAFTTPKQITVVHRGRAVGSIFLALDMIPEGFILLAGKRWKIRVIDLEKNTIDVESAEGGKAPPFGGDEGPEIHSRVRRGMRDVLLGGDVPGYLDAGAARMLAGAREIAAAARMGDSPFVEEKRNLLWFPWESSAVHRTLYAMGLIAGMEVEDRNVALEFKRTTPAELRAAYSPFLKTPPGLEQIVRKFEVGKESGSESGSGFAREKYDRFVPTKFLLASFARRRLDLKGAMEATAAAFGSGWHV
ncbi:MAG: DEAD/DEAH box helicase [Synergistaceae bacterium]|jgi:ATP-dependent Lhr-like helicase|nr:DEAD/DEAH box helicase [Synergistaceae bacterium]